MYHNAHAFDFLDYMAREQNLFELEAHYETDRDHLLKQKLSSISTSTGVSENKSSCFDCNICIDSAHDPVVTLCGHLYCWACIYEWLHVQTSSQDADKQQQNCPVLRPPPMLNTSITSTTTSTTHRTPQLHPDLFQSRTQSLHNPQYFPHHYGGYAAIATSSLSGMATISFVNPLMGMFGGMVLERIFGSSVTSLSAYPSSHPLMTSGNRRIRRQEVEIDKVDYRNMLHYIKFSKMGDPDLKGRTLYGGSCELETWISAAITARVQELQLCSKYKAIGDGLPSSLFNCKSLVTLRLNIGYVVRFPDNFCFPNMKIIDFCDVHFGKNFSDQLLNSKNLEEIYFMHCRIDIYNSSSPSSLTVGEDVVADDSHCSGTFPNLNKATIVLGKHPGKEEETGFCASKFIKTLSNANVLYLSNACIQLLQYCGGNLLDYLPTFCNLKRLQLTVSIKDGDIGVLSCLLDRSPILESLGIRFFNYKFRSLVSRCNRELKRGEYARHLECIRMEHFRGSKNQVELVRFFLANAQVLKKMSLYSDREFPLSLYLFEFPRLSTSCQLLIY
ncbi:hypothetical protein Pint_04516 [Pistacia integerrima]|uniref:Uncharacterized protein n=1 Tax=Pistacia integerrima TaxID=434235 RepID=A0ACC0Z8C3_9ROSI|nr:hypothetical protein Pint_04516 [Pistacia integerrima]